MNALSMKQSDIFEKIREKRTEFKGQYEEEPDLICNEVNHFDINSFARPKSIHESDQTWSSYNPINQEYIKTVYENNLKFLDKILEEQHQKENKLTKLVEIQWTQIEKLKNQILERNQMIEDFSIALEFYKT